ncbi:MAG: Hsp20/alpha crystallin family protein [Planctomycetota bacterium]
MSDSCNETDRPADKIPPPLERVRHEMDRWIDAAKSTGERALETLGLLGSGRPSMPAIDIIELAEEVVVLIDLPGVSAEAVELSLTGNMLTVKATRTGNNFPEATHPHLHLTERANIRFERAIPLPVAVNADAIRAETRDGLLTVSLLKVIAAPSRTIPVARGGTQPSSSAFSSAGPLP